MTATTAWAQTAKAQDRLRWELVTNGATPISTGGTTSGGTPTNLSNTSEDLLFRLDLQPLITQRSALNDAKNVKADRATYHLQFETGILAAGRTTTATSELAASSAVQALTQQGSTVTPPKTTSGPALTQQRAYTFGGEGSINWQGKADGDGTMAEFGAVARFRYNVFLDDKSITQKDGLTYINLAGPDNGFLASEVGVRFRLTQFNETKTVTTMNGGAMTDNTPNTSDLLVVEWHYQHDGAMAGLTPGVLTQHRSVFRALAYVPVQPTGMKDALKFVIGVETSQDFTNTGPKIIRVFYGANVNLKSLF